MAVFEQKNPVLVDLDRGILGTFSHLEEQGTEKDFVYIWYVPFNSFGKVRYTNPIPKKAIHNVYPSNAMAEKQLMFIFEGVNDSIMNFIDTKNQQLIKQLQDKIKDLEVEKAAAAQRAEDAYSGAEKVVQRAKQITKTTEPKNPLDPFGNNMERKSFEDF